MYIYPENMGVKMKLFFWTLRDGLISMGLAALGLYVWLSAGIPVIMAGAGLYAFLSIQMERCNHDGLSFVPAAVYGIPAAIF